MKNFLIISSLDDISQTLFEVFSALEKSGRLFYLLSSRVRSFEKFKLNSSKARKVYLGPCPSNNFYFFLFLLLLPALYVFYFFTLLTLRYKKGVKTLVCLSSNEKIIFSGLAKILGFKAVWLELPDINYRKMPSFFLKIYRFCSRGATIIVFSSATDIQLKKLGFSAESITSVPMGIKLNQLGRQETIFSSLAKADKAGVTRKYFTIGTTTDFLPPNQIEALFQAVKICLTVIPGMQLIVIGEVEEANTKAEQEKKLGWLAEKIGINNLVWFVRDQDNLKKWLESLDLFVITSETSSFFNLSLALRVMHFGLPVIGFANRGYENIISENKTGVLVETSHSEALAQKIIEFYNSRHLRANLGRQAQEAVEKSFNIEEMVKQFEVVLDSQKK